MLFFKTDISKATSTGKEIPMKVSSNPEDKPNPNPGTGFYFLFIFLALGVVLFALQQMAGGKKSPIEVDEKGNVTLAPHRKEKLEKELEEIDNAVQYALRAENDGYFPCFTCPDGKGTIYLYKGELWRIGTTRKGVKGRYPRRDYGAPNLTFFVEFEGTYSECLKMEKIKIYNYPLLQEAMNRDFILTIPPGNLIDN
jgi:hypothetical protein